MCALAAQPDSPSEAQARSARLGSAPLVSLLFFSLFPARFFNAHTFKLEEKCYADERIKFDHVSYIDNQPVLDLIESVGKKHTNKQTNRQTQAEEERSKADTGVWMRS